MSFSFLCSDVLPVSLLCSPPGSPAGWLLDLFHPQRGSTILLAAPESRASCPGRSAPGSAWVTCPPRPRLRVPCVIAVTGGRAGRRSGAEQTSGGGLPVTYRLSHSPHEATSKHQDMEWDVCCPCPQSTHSPGRVPDRPTKGESMSQWAVRHFGSNGGQ